MNHVNTPCGDALLGKPYLSIVATARNDDHGGNLLGRMQLFVDSLADQAARHDMNAELVIVQWNPPDNRPRLADALRWPTTISSLPTRIITVPASVHEQFEHHDRLPLFQMIGKNVGLRRARGEFLLATNVDILLHDDLAKRLAKRTLLTDRMYRADRHDVPQNVPTNLTPAQRLQWCKANVHRINSREGSLDVHTGAFYRMLWAPSLRVRLVEMLQDLRAIPTVTRRRLHTNACGDFTMMHRSLWKAVGGYMQWPMYSMHMDYLLCHQAVAAGATECVLPEPCYHVDHAVGSGWSPTGGQALENRLAKQGIPQLELSQVNDWCIKMRREGRPMQLSDHTWGLADTGLPEQIITGQPVAGATRPDAPSSAASSTAA